MHKRRGADQTSFNLHYTIKYIQESVTRPSQFPPHLNLGKQAGRLPHVGEMRGGRGAHRHDRMIDSLRQQAWGLPHVREMRRGRAQQMVEEGELVVGGDAGEGGQVDEDRLIGGLMVGVCFLLGWWLSIYIYVCMFMDVYVCMLVLNVCGCRW